MTTVEFPGNRYDRDELSFVEAAGEFVTITTSLVAKDTQRV